MPKLHVTQARSGEGWILTSFSNVGPEVIPQDMPDLMTGVLLVACEDFAQRPPAGGERLEDTLYALRGEAASKLLREHARWSGAGAIFAAVAAVPDADGRRKWIANPLRPWDAERLGAAFYGQVGRRFHHRGVWFAHEADRRRFVESSVRRLLEDAGHRLPNGDVTLVLELPTDSTFEAEFAVSGAADSLRIVRRFPERGFVRTWSVRRGEWVAEESKLPMEGRGGNLASTAVQWLASAGILVLAIPTFLMVVVVAIVAKLTGVATTTSTSRLPPAPRATP